MFPRPPLSFSNRRRWLQLTFLSIAAVIAFSLIPHQAVAQDSKAQSPNAQRPGKAAGTTSDVARGKYLVEGVAMCGQCHTPRDSNGRPDQRRWLQGAPIRWLSPNGDPNWPLSAPRIGGTPPANDADMIRLLTTGIWTTGERLRDPMPQFRMDRSDAEAVVAYLKSLTSQQ